MMKRVCVLTGDIIASKKASATALEAAFKALSDGAERLERWWPKLAPSRFTRYRGDGWHVIVSDASRSLRSAVYLTARLRQADTGLSTRIAIGIGSVSRVGLDNLSDARGAAFELSGQSLDEMKRGEIMTITGDGVTPLHKAIIALAAERASRWSREQAEAVALCMTSDVLTQSEAAQQLGISDQAISARLSSAGYSSIMTAVNQWEAYSSFSGARQGVRT